jgi:hypothetical protein
MATSLDDIFNELDASSERRRKQDMIRSFTGPRIPYVHDLEELEWRPLPKLDAVRHTLKAGASRRFITATKHCGYALSEPAYAKPKVLNYWTAERAVQPERNYAYSNHAQPPRFHHQSEPLPEPTDDLLDKSRKDWLVKHNEERIAKVYPIAHAIDRVEKARRCVQANKQMREMTAEILSKGPEGVLHSPKLGEHAKTGLNKVMGMVKTSRAFRQAVDMDTSLHHEEISKRKLEKAKSAPALQFYHPPPDGRVQHLRRFQYTNPICGSIRQTTPWQHEDEIQDLKNLGRKTW